MSAIASPSAMADMSLTRADVSAFQNRVNILLRDGLTRPVRPNDWLSIGDAIQTQRASQVDLRFNDGSLARVGELATFWFVPNTRNLRLAKGTVLLLMPFENGASTIETPNVVTGIQGAALLVRYFPPSDDDRTVPLPASAPEFEQAVGRTAVLVLTDSPTGPVTVGLRDGRQVSLTAGQMAIVDDQDLYLFEFDLNLFYETSPILAGLTLDEQSLAAGTQPTHAVRQEMRNSLEQQADFVGDYLLNPSFLGPDGETAADGGWLFPASSLQNPPIDTPPVTTPDENSEATAAPHELSDTAIELVPPAELGELETEEAINEPPSGLPPGVVMPSIDTVSPAPDTSETLPVSPLPQRPDTANEVPTTDDSVPNGSNDNSGDN
jgi:acrosin